MSIIAWIILGALAGWIASLIMKTDTQQGAFANIIIGILGALIGGFVVSLFGGQGVNDFSLYSLVVATFGAVIFLAILRAIRGGV
jgi:uncharacterized membrane protein YeaQ/YmgE (transglycosylase-associated protein family)